MWWGNVAHNVYAGLIVALIGAAITLVWGTLSGGDARDNDRASRPSTPQRTTPVPEIDPKPPPVSAPAPQYLTSLDYRNADPGDLTVGLAVIGGRRYTHSFTQKVCSPEPIVVPIEGGYRQFSATVGYADDSGSRGSPAGGTLDAALEYTAELPSDDSEWIRLEILSLPARKRGAKMSVKLPPDAAALRLDIAQYACSTVVVWGNPRVS